jgi:hypothetical protein
MLEQDSTVVNLNDREPAAYSAPPSASGIGDYSMIEITDPITQAVI